MTTSEIDDGKMKTYWEKRSEAMRALNQKWWCTHPSTEVRQRPNSAGIIIYQHQCLICGVSKGPAVSKSSVDYIPRDFDTTLEERYKAREQADRDKVMAEIEKEEERRKAQYRDWYNNDYLRSRKWIEKRKAVMQRADGICEGCLTNPATQVHHLTYDHVGDELLFELVAVCDDCHAKAHGLEGQRAA